MKEFIECNEIEKEEVVDALEIVACREVEL
jgi:hypothetical protein